MLRICLILALVLGFGQGACLAQTQPSAPLEETLRKADDLLEKGDLAAARRLFESVRKSLPTNPSRDLGHALNGLSHIALSEGDYQNAMDLAQQADHAYEQLGQPDGRAFAMNNRGIAEGELGRYSAAQASLREALTFSRAAQDFETEVRTLNNLGGVSYFPGQYQEALQAYQNAWSVLQNHPSEKWADYWTQITRINEATLFQRLARYETSLQLYRKVDTSASSLSASDRAHLFTNLGVLYRRLGDPYKALDAYQEALKLYGAQRDADGDINALKNIGIVYALDQGDLGKAQMVFERALQKAEQSQNQSEVSQAHLYLGEVHLRRNNLLRSQREFQAALDQAQQLKLQEEQWKALYGLGRTEQQQGRLSQSQDRYRDAIAVIESTRSKLQLAALRAEFLADKRDPYDALIGILLDNQNVRDAFEYVERSRSRTFQDRLELDASGKSTSAGSPTLEEIRSRLDPETVLLEYWTSGNRIALIWCTQASFGADQISMSPDDRERMIRFLRGLPHNLQGDWRTGASVLAMVLPPQFRLPKQIKHILIVPDGWLSSMPFDIVPAERSSTTLLIERADISYLPTAALLRRFHDGASKWRFAWMQELVAFGNPVVPKADTAADTLETVSALPPLPYSEVEVLNLAKMVRGRAELFLASAARKSNFLGIRTPRPPLLHVSTHGFTDLEVPENSRLLFSSAMPNAPPDSLYLRELYEMDLRGVDLATLSACDTERGQMLRGEGAQAFSRALLAGGARSALTTLWRIDDQPASEFMNQFYFHALRRHETKSEALRAAKLAFLHSDNALANPAHWAGFVLNGDGLQPLPYFLPWGGLFLSAICVLLTLAVPFWVVLLRRRRHRVDRPQPIVAQ